MDFSVLGPLRVTSAGAVVDIRGVKERTLLAHLVARAGQVVPAGDLVDTLWGEEPPRSASKSLQTYVLRLRNSIEPDRDGTPRLLVTEGPGYRLAVDPADVDAGVFARLVELGERSLAESRPEAAVSALRDGLALWRGPAYAGFEHTGFGRAEGRRLAELRMTATEALLHARLDLEQAPAVAAEVERLLGDHPLRERLWEILLLALYRSARQGDALAAYERVRTVLAEELGVDPGPQLRALHARILAQDAGLSGTRHRNELPPSLRPPPGPVLGRAGELQRLMDAWERTLAGAPATVVVRGPEGAGRRRLASSFAATVAGQGHPVHVHGTGVDPDRPALIVADRVSPTQAAADRPRRAMVLALAGAGAETPDDAEVLDLGPLDAQSVRALLAQYVDADQVDAAAAELLDGSTPAWPGRVLEAAAEAARTAAVRRIELATAAAGASSAQLSSARAALTDGIEVLTEMTTTGPRPGVEACPWRGLASYDVHDAPWFAGRERLVAELVARLAGVRLLAVVGASGSGKSSTVRAGLLASLAADVLPGSAAWRMVCMRPGTHPMRELAKVALEHPIDDVGDVLSAMIRTEGSSPRTVLVVDQAEEVWVACEDAGERAAFLDTVTELGSDPASEVTVVLVIRSDYLVHVADRPRLSAALADATVLVGTMTEAEVRRAVERPAARAQLRLEDGLADTIVSDAGQEPGMLPLLSTTMTSLWERQHDGILTYAGYVAAGGLPGAIAHLAEETWERLDGEQQAAARSLLLRLTGPGEGSAVTRRRVPLSEIEAVPRPGLLRAVEALSDARLLTVSEGYVEVAHEALFRRWPRLRSWLADDAAGRAVQRRLAVAAAEWENDERDPAHLWRGTRLLSALEVVDARPEEVTVTERAFIDASQAAVHAQERAARERAEAAARRNVQLRRLLVGLVVLLGVALVAGALALVARGEAESSARDARRSAVSAAARALAADALNQDYQDVALLEAVEATRLQPGPESYGALLTLLTRTPEVVKRYRTFDRFLRIGASPDGRTVYLSDNTTELHALDAASGELRWQATSPDGSGQWGQAAASKDGAALAVPLFEDTEPDTGRVLAVLDAATGELRRSVTVGALRRLDPEERGLVSENVGFRRDGLIVLPTSQNVFLVDPASGRVRDRVPWPGEKLPFAWIRRDGLVVAQADDRTSARVDTRSPGRRSRSASLPGSVVGLSPDGRWVATSTVRQRAGSEWSHVRIRDADTWRSEGPAVAVEGYVREVDWARGELLVATEEHLELRDPRTLQLRRTFTGHNGALLGFAVVGSTRDVVWTAGRDGSAIAYDLTGRRGVVRSRPHPGPLRVGDADDAGAVAIHTPFGGAEPNPARMLEVASGADLYGELRPRPGCFCPVSAVDMAGDGSVAVGVVDHLDTRDFTSTPRNHVAVWDPRDGSLRSVLRLPWRATGLALSPDGSLVAVNGVGQYGVLDLESGELVWERRHPTETDWFESMPQTAFAPDGRTVVVLRNETVVVADALTGELRIERELADARVLLRAAWGPDSSTLVLGSMTGRLYFLDPATLEPVAPQRLLTGGFVIDIETGGDQAMMAAMGSDGDVTLFDTRTWRPYGKPVTDGLGWGFLAFTGDTLRIFSEYGSVTTVETDPTAWVRRACAIVNRELSDEESQMIRPGDANTPVCS